MLDQLMVSRGLLKDGPLIVDKESAEIVRLPAMLQGKRKSPHRFGRRSKGNLDLEGYSDHFPVAVKITCVTD